ncbi:MAG: hypothetical protein EPO11_07880 [Gammaproteobacteria bacterium]|nr:MAG: hypothetical protein EPO11_07880 [Gammaproteobacteria bacterium]
MAQDILANSSSKLNLSRRQTAMLQRILITASQMAEILEHCEQQAIDVERAVILSRRWSHLIVEYAKMLL